MAPRALNTSAKSAHIGSVSGSRTFYSAVASWASPTSTEQQQFALEGHATSLDAGIRQHYFNELSPAIITQSSVDAVASTSTSSIDYATRGRILPPVVVAPAQLSTSTPAIAGTSTSANPMPQVVPPLSARAQSTPPGTFDASSSSNGANPSSSAASTASTPAGPRYLSDEWCEAAMPPCQSIEEAIRSWTMAEDGNAAVAELKMHGRIGIKDLSADKVKTLLEEVPIKPSGAWPLFLGQYKKYHSETARVQRGPGSNVPVDATGDMKEAAKVWAWMLPSRLGNPSPQVKWKALSEEMKTRHKEIFSGYDIGLRQVLQMLNTRLNKKKGRKASSTCPASSSTAVAATLPISSHTVDHPVQAPHSVALPPLNIPHPSHADHPPRSVTGSTEAASIPLAHSASALPVGQHADNGLFRYSQPIARRPNREIANSARMSPYPRPSTTPSYVSRNPALVHLSMARTSTTSSPANDLSLDHVPLLRTSSRMSTSSLTSCATPPPLSRQNSLTSISDIYEAGSRSMSATPGASTSFSNATLESSSDAAFAFSDFDDGNEESMNTMNDADNGYADFAGTTSTPNDGYGHRTSTSPTSGNTLNLDFGYEAPTPSNDILATTSTEESSTSINDFRYFGGSASSSTESTSAYPSWYGATPQDYQNAAATQWLELGYLTDSSEKSGPF
ncbi:hypothetical protein EST38_g5999 [Candolleomyces aberdarensis]|uniref:Uncharacterized protein n=1 Tax=Candolleomyces aberdarensis TaxID=2316362 RepID=A0A4Q2DLR9_9AGAR|nr:hypothetical protein EST38_g5999 [Candolleomyces aberdarensis]